MLTPQEKVARGDFPASFAKYVKKSRWGNAPRPKKKALAKIQARAQKRKIEQANPGEYFEVHGKDDYRHYLATQHWKKTRAMAMRVLGRKCSVCGTYLRFPQVHHKHYKTLWHEKPSDLIILCRAHHEVHHLGVTGNELEHLRACAVGK
jgi:predicted restriction endonuclease